MHKELIEAGMKYSGEITCYSRAVQNDCIAGVSGVWWLHEFGGAVFVPRSTADGVYVNKASYEWCDAAKQNDQLLRCRAAQIASAATGIKTYILG